MDPRLERLIELQKARGAQFEVEQEKADLPNQRAVLEAELNNLQSGVEKAQEDHQQAELLQRRKEKLLAEAQESRKKKQTQLMAIKNNKEYTATNNEIQTLSKRIGRLEDEIVTAMEDAEKAAKEIEEKEAKLNEKRPILEARIEEISGQEAELDKRIDVAKGKADAVAENVDKALLRRFMRIFEARHGIAMATANGDYCGACNVRLTKHTVQLAKRGQDFVICEGCGRFLYWDHEMEETPVF